MVDERQGLPFRLEAGDQLARIHTRLDDLESDFVLDGLLRLGYVDDAESAPARTGRNVWLWKWPTHERNDLGTLLTSSMTKKRLPEPRTPVSGCGGPLTSLRCVRGLDDGIALGRFGGRNPFSSKGPPA